MEAAFAAHSVAVRSGLLESIALDVVLLLVLGHHAAAAARHHVLVRTLSIIVAIMGPTMIHVA